MSRSGKGASRMRTVHYSFEPANDTEGDLDMNVEARLARAKANGIITNYDDGRDRWPWFEGRPGAAIRALRDEFAATPRKPRHLTPRPESTSERGKFMADRAHAQAVTDTAADHARINNGEK